MKQTLDFHLRGLDPGIAETPTYTVLIQERPPLQMQIDAGSNSRHDHNNLQKVFHVTSRTRNNGGLRGFYSASL
jgi:hypothetical protein